MSDLEKKYLEAKKVLQGWTDKQEHDRCWYYPDLFRKLIDIFEIKPSKEARLPPLEEFKRGCEKYQREEYKMFNL